MVNLVQLYFHLNTFLKNASYIIAKVSIYLNKINMPFNNLNFLRLKGIEDVRNVNNKKGDINNAFAVKHKGSHCYSALKLPS